MADTVSVEYLYPPNWDLNPPESGGWRRVIAQLRGVSDGTGETDVQKIDISELRTTDGRVPTRTAVEWIQYSVSEGWSVLLEWDRSPNSVIVRLTGSGELDWTKTGGKPDASEAGDRTGDIQLTTVGAAANDSYDITICLKLKV